MTGDFWRHPMCPNCRYWERFNGQDTGKCRRNPPTLFAPVYMEYRNEGDLPHDAAEMATIFPVTSEEDWCGQFEDGGNGKD